MTSRISWSLAALLVVGLLLFGCAQAGPKTLASPTPSGFASATPAPSSSANSVAASPSPSATPDTSGLDQVGPDIDNLDSLSKDLSAGDVSPPADGSAG